MRETIEAVKQGIGVFWFSACLGGGLGLGWWFWSSAWAVVFR